MGAETALRSVVVHLWELRVLRAALGWHDLRVGKVSVDGKVGRWVYDDHSGEGRWEDDADGEPWTVITA